MASLDGTITMTSSEYRPCYVRGRKALFHRWIEKETPILHIETQCKASYNIMGILENYEKQKILPEHCKIDITKCTFALIEYENGEVAEVEPTQVRFADRKINEYYFE